MPWTARPASRTVIVGATAHTIVPSTNGASAARYAPTGPRAASSRLTSIDEITDAIMKIVVLHA
jgi:hypothetical protein